MRLFRMGGVRISVCALEETDVAMMDALNQAVVRPDVEASGCSDGEAADVNSPLLAIENVCPNQVAGGVAEVPLGAGADEPWKSVPVRESARVGTTAGRGDSEDGRGIAAEGIKGPDAQGVQSMALGCVSCRFHFVRPPEDDRISGWMHPRVRTSAFRVAFMAAALRSGVLACARILARRAGLLLRKSSTGWLLFA
jgi:hypothetical protein